VCLKCFDSFAAKRGIDYSRNLRVIYFAGIKPVFKFTVARRAG
jgi:hypothetical protein